MDHGSVRLHYMDSMRAALMMLGVVLHSAQVFNPAGGWLIHSDRPVAAATWLVEAIALFRMPAFFMVAGFFSVLLLRKYGSARYTRMRLERLGIPLLVTALLLNSGQAALLAGAGLMEFDLGHYLAGGGWQSHLWFLLTLLLYALGVHALMNTRLAGPAAWLKPLAARVAAMPPTLLLVALPAAHLLLMKSVGVTGLLSFGVVAGVFDAYTLLSHLPYFAFGLLLGARTDFLERFTAVPPLFSMALIVACLWLADGVQAGGLPERLLVGYLQLVAAWSATALCFHLFRRLAAGRSPLARALSDASYTVYLFHHVLVVVFAIVLIQFDLGGPAGLVTLIALVAASTLFIHKHLVEPSPIARFLFNGVRSGGAAMLPAWLVGPR